MSHPWLASGSRTIVLLASVAWATLAGAQAGTISGTVIDARSGLPLPAVSIAVDGSTSTARSGTRGEFRLANVPGATARLRLTRIGYQATNVDARVGDATVRVTMSELAIKLDAVVISGTAGEAQRRSLGNSVGLVDVATTLALSVTPAEPISAP